MKNLKNYAFILIAVITFFTVTTVTASVASVASASQRDPHTDLSGGAVVCYNSKPWSCGGKPGEL